MTAHCHAQTGQWYLRQDTAEIFQVTGYDDTSRTIEIQTLDGDLDELDEESWRDLPIIFAEPPQDWIDPIDDPEADSEDVASDLSGVRPSADAREAWEDVSTTDEIDGLTEEAVPEDWTVEPSDDDELDEFGPGSWRSDTPPTPSRH